MRRRKKYSCKNRGGVAREVSRRERDISNTFGPATRKSEPLICLVTPMNTLNDPLVRDEAKTRWVRGCDWSRICRVSRCNCSFYREDTGLLTRRKTPSPVQP